MFEYARFIKKYIQPVGFGAALTCASSFGQTFMVSQFVPSLLEELNLSNAVFGGIYSGATLVSATILMRAGKRVDTEALDRYTIKAAVILCSAALLLAASIHPAMLFAALFGLRLAGQGLMSHISQTVMARHFGKSRGKALSLSALGYSAGELFIPVILAFSIPIVGWRTSLAALALTMLAAVVVMVKALPVRSFEKSATEDALDEETPTAGEKGKFDLRRNPTFWLIAAPGWVFTVSSTGYFFYQMVMVRDRGWDPKWYALVFVAYALARVAAIFGTGTLVDRLGARFLYPLHFFPFLFGCAAFGFTGTQGPLTLYMVALGLTMGASSVMQSAVLAEIYGPEIVGTVRSVFAATMIFGAAAGPAVFGFFLDRGIPMRGILLGIAALSSLGVLASFRTWKPPRGV